MGKLSGKMKESTHNEIFEAWLKEYPGLFFKVIHAYAFNQEDRDDLFQEISVQAWKSVPNFKGESKVSTWLYRIALNTAIKWSQKERKHSDGRQSIAAADYLLHEKDHPIDERLAWLYEEIAKLNEIDRSLCLLLLDGFSYQEMAGILGISESNVAVKIHRLKKHLMVQSQKINTHGI
jgi:RNA polymerase sigma-70 factor (ECF subfamily)